MYVTGMSLQELRLFSVYLSCINPRDKSTANVTFSLADLKKILNDGKRSIDHYRQVLDSLLVKRIAIEEKDGTFTGFTFFSQVELKKNEYGEWYAVLYATESALPLLFGFKSHYFKYRLWNVLNLRSKNHIRMFEILTQYVAAGSRVITLDKLRNMMGLESESYLEYRVFKRDILIPCQKAIEECTDISFTFEVASKKGRKIDSLKFTIIKKKNFEDPMADAVDVKAEQRAIAEEEKVGAEAAKVAAKATPVITEPEPEVDKPTGLSFMRRPSAAKNPDHVIDPLPPISELVNKVKVWGKVHMKDAEYKALVTEYGKEMIDEYIADMETYLKAHGKPGYDDYAAAIRMWIERDKKEAKKKAKEQAKPKRNRFANFESRERDYALIEQLEREHLIKSLEISPESGE